jgi:hypothetical protein
MEKENERMAKLRKNAVISGLRGKLGKDHYARHTRDGKTISARTPILAIDNLVRRSLPSKAA